MFARNYDRNKKLIILSEETIPSKIYKDILNDYEEQSKNFKRKNIIEISNPSGGTILLPMSEVKEY